MTNFLFLDRGRFLLSIFEKFALVPLGEYFYKQAFVIISKKIKSEYFSNKILYKDDSPLYEIQW